MKAHAHRDCMCSDTHLCLSLLTRYNGCADAINSPYHNNGGMNYWAPSMWSDVMSRDLGKPAGDCTQTAPGVFERRFGQSTVRLDCNTWKATFD